MADPNQENNEEMVSDQETVSDIEMMTDSDDLDAEIFDFARDVIPPVVHPQPDEVVYGPHRAQSANGVIIFNGTRLPRFAQTYNVLPVVFWQNLNHQQSVEGGGKVILPSSALEHISLISETLVSPMLFKATNRSNQKFTHCGVLEFTAEEGVCYMPQWMMEFLDATEHTLVQFERVKLPTATFAKFEPQSVDFLEISNPKAILENSLRSFACLTKDDLLAIRYNGKVYKLSVLETLPADAVTIIGECDVNVDFAPPVGYVDPSESRHEGEGEAAGADTFLPFSGTGKRLNGKDVSGTTSTKKLRLARGTPDTDWKIGSLVYKRQSAKTNPTADNQSSKFIAFGGEGQSLK